MAAIWTPTYVRRLEPDSCERDPWGGTLPIEPEETDENRRDAPKNHNERKPMNKIKHLTVMRSSTLLGAVVGFSIGFLALLTPGTGGDEDAEVLQAFHRQPALVQSGETVSLTYDTVCPWDEEKFRRGEELCRVAGVVHVKATGTASFEAFDLASVPNTPYLRIDLPDRVVRDGFVYFAEIVDELSGELVRVPSGSVATHQAWVFGAATHVNLEVPDQVVPPAELVVNGPWGDKIGEFGTSGGDESAVLGPAAFGFDADGALVVLDQINERLLIYAGAQAPREIAIEHTRALADLEIAVDGTRYVLDGSAAVRPHLTAYDAAGREIATSMLTDFAPGQLSAVDGRVMVQGGMRSMWAQIFDGVRPVLGSSQLDQSTTSRRLSATGRGDAQRLVNAVHEGAVPIAGLDQSVRNLGVVDGAQVTPLPIAMYDPRLVVAATDDEARFAIVDGPKVLAAWRVTSDRNIGEVQLAEVHDGHLVVVLRTWTDDAAEFEVLRFKGSDLKQHLVLEDYKWADSAVLGVFEIGPNGLYQLRSDLNGFSIVRFDFGGVS